MGSKPTETKDNISNIVYFTTKTVSWTKAGSKIIVQKIGEKLFQIQDVQNFKFANIFESRLWPERISF